LSLGFFPLLLVMVMGEELFSVIFGSQWAKAGIYAQILAPWIMFQFISSPISTLFSVLEMQGTGLVFNSILLVTRIASLLIGGFLNSVMTALMLFSFTGAILYLGLCLLILRKSGSKISILVKDVLQTGIISLIAVLPVVIIKVCDFQPLISVIAACLSLLFFYMLLYFRDEELRKLVRLYRSK